MKIDFVIPWVDGNDPAWQEERRKYNPDSGTDSRAVRYRDMGTLKYWFRAVEEYAPWVNKIHFITWGHLPDWLNTEHPKLHIVNHRDYIPEEYLPTFSTNPIELNMHRIEGLSEHFVYFNDDTLLNSFVTPEFFFHKGLPCDFAYIDAICDSDSTCLWSHMRVNCTWVINNRYSYIKSFLKNPLKFVSFKYPFKNVLKNVLKLENCNIFQGFDEHHLPAPYLKTTLMESWKENESILHFTSCNKFRTSLDVTQSIFRCKQLAQGNFHPVSKKSRGKVVFTNNEISDIEQCIMNPTLKQLCINDSDDLPNFEEVSNAIISIYEKKHPNKSSFEK